MFSLQSKKLLIQFDLGIDGLDSKKISRSRIIKLGALIYDGPDEAFRDLNALHPNVW